jgi:hypothetical protein
VSVRSQWWVREASATRALELAAERLTGEHGLIAAYDRGAVVLSSGSPAAIVDAAVLCDRELPARARLWRGRTRDDLTLVLLQVEDALEAPVMDLRLRRRYADWLGRIARDLGAALAAVTEVYDAGPEPCVDG